MPILFSRLGMAFKAGSTEYLSAERSTEEEIKNRGRLVAEKLLRDSPVRNILDSVFDLAMILDLNRQAVFVNRAMLKFLNSEGGEGIIGFRPGEMFGCTYAYSSESGCGTTRFCHLCKAPKAIVAAQSGRPDMEECQILLKDGNALDLSIVATPIRLDNEELTFVAIRDISDQKRREALERVFFHDVLNVAGVVYSLSDMMRSVPPEKMPDVGAKIFTASKRLVEEIQAQRNLSVAENNELVVDLETLGSLDMIRQAAQIYEGHDVARGKGVAIDPASEAIGFESDRVILSRVLGNMLKNALEASKAGDTVTIGCRHENDSVVFWVGNSSFMPEDVQQQVFKRSFSTKGKGRGLGTYSIKLLSERYLKGKVSFESDPQKGTTFFAEYPAKK